MPSRNKVEVVITASNQAKPALDAAAKGLAEVGAQAQRSSAQLSGFGSRLTGLVDGLGKIGMGVFGIQQLAQGVASLAQGMVAGNAEFERYETQFGVLLGSAKAAKDRLQELAEFGARTPFELPEVVRADKILTAFGLDAQDTFARFKVSAEQIRETVGDVASGTGASFEEIASAFGRFASGATGEAIQRFQELGIATREQMASWGLQFSKSGELLTPAREAFSILERHVREKFGGMMKAQSETFEGMMSNLSDWFGMAKRTIMAPIFDVLKDSLKGVLDLLGSPAAKAGLQAFAQGMARGVASVVNAFKAAGRAVRDFLKYLDPANTRDLMREWFGDFGPVIDQFVRGLKGGIRAVSDFVDQFHDNWIEIGQVLQQEGLPGVAQYITSWLADEFRKIDWGRVWRSVTGVGTMMRVMAIQMEVTDWLRAQWAKIDWAAIWSAVKGVGEGLARSALNIGSSVVGWLARQWSSIDWGAVWGAVRGVGEGLIRSALSIATSIGTWLGQQFSSIDWAGIWGAIRGIGEGLIRAGVSIAGDVATWLGQQWAAIDWTSIWAAAGNFANGLEAKIAGLAGAVGNWIAGVWASIDWAGVWNSIRDFASGLEQKIRELQPRVQATLEEVWAGLNWPAIWAKAPQVTISLGNWFAEMDWNALGRQVGRFLGGMFVVAQNALVDLITKPETATTILKAIAGIFLVTGDVIQALLEFAQGIVEEFYNQFSANLPHIRGQMQDALVDFLKTIFLSLPSLVGNTIKSAIESLFDTYVLAPTRAKLAQFNAQIASIVNPLRGLNNLLAPTAPYPRSIPPPNSRQGGGPVWPGSSFLVGERGPELFRPQRAGDILPFGAVASTAGGRSIVLNAPLIGSVTVRDEADEDRLARKIWAVLTDDFEATRRGGVR